MAASDDNNTPNDNGFDESPDLQEEDILELEDEDGNTLRLALLVSVEVDGRQYVMATPLDELPHPDHDHAHDDNEASDQGADDEEGMDLDGDEDGGEGEDIDLSEDGVGGPQLVSADESGSDSDEDDDEEYDDEDGEEIRVILLAYTPDDEGGTYEDIEDQEVYDKVLQVCMDLMDM